MQVSEQFPAFRDPTLLVAVDLERARILLARDREVREYATVQLPRQERRSGGGHTTVRSRGAVIVRGTQREWQRRQGFHRLLTKLNETLLRAVGRENVGALYLFAADQRLREASRALPPSLRKLVVRTIPADLTHATPKQLLERITKERRTLPKKLKALRVPR